MAKIITVLPGAHSRPLTHRNEIFHRFFFAVGVSLSDFQWVTQAQHAHTRARDGQRGGGAKQAHEALEATHSLQSIYPRNSRPGQCQETMKLTWSAPQPSRVIRVALRVSLFHVICVHEMKQSDKLWCQAPEVCWKKTTTPPIYEPPIAPAYNESIMITGSSSEINCGAEARPGQTRTVVLT